MKRIGIGYENYKEFIDEGLYYVDKTLLIRDVLEKGGKVTLFIRPRRFGKTLALSMLRPFFEQEYASDGSRTDHKRYFEGMKIMDQGEAILSHMGRYPVIKLSLKSAKQPSFSGAFFTLREEIVAEFRRHDYLLQSKKLSEEELAKYKRFLRGENEWWEQERHFQNDEERKNALQQEVKNYATALKTLSQCLKKHHDSGVIMLIDEYDVPLENAYFEGFYEEMIRFIRSLFESALKTNDALERAVITGCLRISRESIFTGLNNLKINSILQADFAEGFGFTQTETSQMLFDYGLADKENEVRDWYDGYLFGETEIYNPWSVTSYVDGKVNGKRKYPVPYWSNTSSNSIIKDLVDRSDEKGKEELDMLIGGGIIEKPIHEDITYDDIYESEENLWNFLFFTGYMRKVAERQEGDDIFLSMRIPNIEIRTIYRTHIRRWFEKIVEKAKTEDLYRAILEKNTKEIGGFLTELLEKSISTYDNAESFYHGFLLSLLYGMPHYSAKSNQEAGDGRPDIVLYPKRPKDMAYIFELKTRKKYNEMENGLEEAFAQIRDRRYEEGILEEGYAGVISYAICFCKKSGIVGIKD